MCQFGVGLGYDLQIDYYYLLLNEEEVIEGELGYDPVRVLTARLARRSTHYHEDYLCRRQQGSTGCF
jgi:hypothetical protein